VEVRDGPVERGGHDVLHLHRLEGHDRVAGGDARTSRDVHRQDGARHRSDRPRRATGRLAGRIAQPISDEPNAARDRGEALREGEIGLHPLDRHIRQGDTVLGGEIGDESDDGLAARAKAEEMSGATFTITNLGMFNTGFFTPLLNPPESAIIGIGSITKKPYVCEDQVVIRPILPLSLTIDHRSVDGAPAAQFMSSLEEMLGTPWQKRINDVRF